MSHRVTLLPHAVILLERMLSAGLGEGLSSAVHSCSNGDSNSNILAQLRFWWVKKLVTYSLLHLSPLKRLQRQGTPPAYRPKWTISLLPPFLSPGRVICCILNVVVMGGSTSYTQTHTHTHTHTQTPFSYVRAHLLLRRMHMSTHLLLKSCSGPTGLKSRESLRLPL